MPTEKELRKHRCFTGHRPEKLKVSERDIKAALKKEIRAAVSEGYSVFISGMAGGWTYVGRGKNEKKDPVSAFIAVSLARV